MELKIYNMSGAGNIFSVIDNRHYNLTKDELIRLTPEICISQQPKTEGLISIKETENPELNFEADFFNPDGSFGAMCGNGGRCAVRFADEMNFFSGIENVNFSMAGSIYVADFAGSLINLRMPPPIEIKNNISFQIEGLKISGSYVNVGSEHFIAPVNQFFNISFEEFYDIDLSDISRKIRYHEFFSPKGVNVNLYFEKDGIIYLRTYERGVEAETGACGTGAVSTALVLHKEKLLPLPLKIVPPSRIPVYVDLINNDNNTLPEGIILSGPAEITGQFTFNY